MAENISVDYIQRKDTILAGILDSILDGVYIVGQNRKIIFWNKAAEDMTRYSREDVLGKRCSDGILNHIDENGRLLCRAFCPIVKAMVTGTSQREKVYPLRKTGGRFPTETHVAPIRGEDGKIIAAIEVFRDISKEEELRILQEKFNRLIKQYVSGSTYEQAMEQARAGGKGAEPRLCDLTIMYLDVVGFTTFSEKAKPDEVVGMLNALFGICELITRECCGDIDKFIGDAIMAVFVDANDAAAAAVKILKALARMNEDRSLAGKGTVSIRIGINSGMVLQGDVGTTRRKDRTVIGDVVNTAARIQTACDPGSIFVSESTYSRLKIRTSFVSAGNFKVKGKADPIPLFKFVASESAASGG